jgi:hypothetical protein
VIGREGPGPERPGPDYPPEWDTEPDARDEAEARQIERESIEDARENDRCGSCGSVDHFREDCPSPRVVVPDPWQVQGPVTPPPF